MKQIPLTQGKYALVDDRDFERLSQFKWCYSRDGYAKRTKYLGGGKLHQKTGNIFMHREILGLSPGDKRQADHIDGNKLNNTRANLRLATHAENLWNQSRQAHNTTGYKGVSCHRRDDNYQASISVNGKRKHLGYFPTAEQAALAYDRAAKEYHGEFARLNSPE